MDSDISMSDAFELLNHISVQPNVLKSVKQQNLPITIKYPEMVAERSSALSEAELHSSGKTIFGFVKH